MSDFLICNLASGAVVRYGHAPDSQIAIQAGPGELAVAVPPGTLTYPDINVEPLRAKLVADVDVAAGVFRVNFITDVPGQAETYLYKANEARAWTADNSANVPFLTAESTARGMAIAALAAEVLAAEAAWIALGAKIEAARMGAKTALAAAATIPAMVAAATVDWAALAA